MSTKGQGALDTRRVAILRIATLLLVGSVPSSQVAVTLNRMLQGGEIIIILLLALVVLGPTRLPELAKKLGEWTAELRSAARDLRRGLEAEVADIKQVGEDLKAPLDELKKSSDEVRKGIEESGVSRLDWEGPKPISGPTPADAMADLDEIEKKAAEEGPQQ